MSAAIPSPPGLASERAGDCAILVVNLGTPAEPTTSATRRYLAEFLSDPRVIELPRLLWLPLLHGVILPFRARRSARAYRSVWTAEGSPLRVFTQRLVDALGPALGDSPGPVGVHMAMRYGAPSVGSVLDRLRDEGVRRLMVLPLYPQYSATTTATVFDAVARALRRWRRAPELRTIADYHGDAAWQQAVTDSIATHWETHPRGELLLFSLHGIPQRYVRAGDPYFEQCVASTEAIAERLGLSKEQWRLSFQSRVGREEWLRPYTDETLASLAASGVRRVDVVCPGFAVDCLETLEEIAVENAHAFTAAGGERLDYIPALNAGAGHVAALAALIRRHGGGWPEFADEDAAPPSPARRSSDA